MRPVPTPSHSDKERCTRRDNDHEGKFARSSVCPNDRVVNLDAERLRGTIAGSDVLLTPEDWPIPWLAS